MMRFIVVHALKPEGEMPNKVRVHERFQSAYHNTFLSGPQGIEIGRVSGGPEQANRIAIPNLPHIAHSLSRRQWTIREVEGNKIELTDNNSAEGTWVNGEHVIGPGVGGTVVLKHGDIASAGPMEDGSHALHLICDARGEYYRFVPNMTDLNAYIKRHATPAPK